MASYVLDMVQQLVSAVGTSGTGALTLSTAQAGYDTFAGAGAVNAGVYSYTIQEGTKWEVGRGTYSTTGPTLTRTTIIKSSAGVATAETFTNACIVICVALKEDFDGASTAQIWTGTDDAQPIHPLGLMNSAAVTALTDGATINTDMNTGFNFSVTLGGNRTLANPTNLKQGKSGVIAVTQDATGSRTLSYGTAWKFPGGAPALSTAANAKDLISYFVVDAATPIILATLSKAFA